MDYSVDVPDSPFLRWSERFKSFAGSDWPKNIKAQPYTLALAGFYYRECYRHESTHKDRVQCYFCGIILQNWNNHDHPIAEHIRHSQRCGFVHRNIDQYHEYLLTLFDVRRFPRTVSEALSMESAMELDDRRRSEEEEEEAASKPKKPPRAGNQLFK